MSEVKDKPSFHYKVPPSDNERKMKHLEAFPEDINKPEINREINKVEINRTPLQNALYNALGEGQTTATASAIPLNQSRSHVRNYNNSETALNRGIQQSFQKRVKKIMELMEEYDPVEYDSYMDPLLRDFFKKGREYEEMDNYKMPKKDIMGYFITVCPEHTEDRDALFLELQSQTLRFIKKKCIDKYMFCFEQKGIDEETIGYHAHVHILIWKVEHPDMEPNKIVREVERIFVGKVGKGKINVKYCNKKHMDAKINYVKGLKSDKAKLKADETTAIWREANELLPYYEG